MANKKKETNTKPEVKKPDTKKVETSKPEKKNKLKNIVYDDNKMYSFEANGTGRYAFIKGKIYSVNGRSAKELVNKKLGKIID